MAGPRSRAAAPHGAPRRHAPSCRHRQPLQDAAHYESAADAARGYSRRLTMSGYPRAEAQRKKKRHHSLIDGRESCCRHTSPS